jgi:transcription elongation factor GreA
MSDDDAQYRITRESLDRLEGELHELETEGRREIAERIKTAREWGDLKENAEYHDAKNSQAHLETKILRLRDRTRNAVIVESAAGAAEAGLGSAVTVHDEDKGDEREYTLVTPTEADPATGAVSTDSPLGRALTGAKPGDVVTVEAPRGTRRLRIVSLS